MLRRRQTVLITSASRSRQSDIQRREVRYLASMAFRVVCFLLAVIVFHGWLRFVAVGIAIVLPWIAVIAANGGPPPERHRPVTFEPQQAERDAPAALTANPHRVVDSEGWVDDEGWVHGSPGRPPAGGAADATGPGPGPDEEPVPPTPPTDAPAR
jgi:hypothetical protein